MLSDGAATMAARTVTIDIPLEGAGNIRDDCSVEEQKETNNASTTIGPIDASSSRLVGLGTLDEQQKR